MPGNIAIALVAAGSLAGAAAAWGAEVPDMERGRALYENHCVACHTPKVHRRVPALPLGSDDLRYIVTLWASQQGLRWSRDEIEDVVHYLDRAHYRFEK
ncbi:MAG TPA: cytochrome c [Burkholderiales bacterium]|nr:cytochrome c [Burkholderiales bacterium]